MINYSQNKSLTKLSEKKSVANQKNRFFTGTYRESQPSQSEKTETSPVKINLKIFCNLLE